MTDGAKRNYVIGFVITFIGSILFSTKAIFVKLAFANTSVDAVSLLMLRMMFSVPFYLAIAFVYSNRKENIPFTGRQWAKIIFLGFIGYYLSSLFDFLGLKYISAGLERLILFLYPTFAILLNAAIFKKKINGVQQLALLLTYAGIAVAYFGELNFNTDNPHFFLGTFFIFLCAVTFSIYLVGSGRLIPMVGATKFTAYMMISASAGVFAHYFISGNSIHSFSKPVMGYGLLLALIATVIPTLFVSNGLKKIGSNNVAIISCIGPVSTIIQAHYILGEPLILAQVIGTILVIAGVLLAGWINRDI